MFAFYSSQAILISSWLMTGIAEALLPSNSWLICKTVWKFPVGMDTHMWFWSCDTTLLGTCLYLALRLGLFLDLLCMELHFGMAWLTPAFTQANSSSFPGKNSFRNVLFCDCIKRAHGFPKPSFINSCWTKVHPMQSKAIFYWTLRDNLSKVCGWTTIFQLTDSPTHVVVWVGQWRNNRD